MTTKYFPLTDQSYLDRMWAYPNINAAPYYVK